MIAALIIFGALFIGILFGFLFSYIQKRKRRSNFIQKRPISSEAHQESIPSDKNAIQKNLSKAQFLLGSDKTCKNILRNSIIVKILALICIIIWIFALIITWKSPSTTYEANIYTAIPIIFWIANILNFIIGIGIIVHQINYKRDKYKTDLWIIGFILVFLAFASIFSLWIIRGYTWLGEGYDSLTHLGWVSDLINSGHIYSVNYYPITHIYLSELSEISNISPIILAHGILCIFMVFCVLFMYCLAKTVLPKKGQAFFALLVWMAFLAGYFVQFAPNLLANYYFPLALFILMKCFYSKQIQWKILLTIMIFLMPMFHPLVGFIFTGFIFIMWLYNILFVSENSLIIKNNLRLVFAFTVISLLWCIYWTSAFQIWRNLIIDVVANITRGTPTNLYSLMGEIEYASNYYNVIAMFLKTYTGQIIIISLAVFGLITLWRRGLWRRDIPKQKLKGLVLLFSPMPFIIGGIGFLYLSSAGFGPTRLIIFIILLCSLFVGYILYELIRRSKIYDYHHKNSRIKFSYFSVVTVSGLLLPLFVIGFLQFYPSRYTLQPNAQITRTEFTGMNWFIRNKEITIDSTSFSVDVYRWASVFLTLKEYTDEGYCYYGASLPTNLRIPWHFGYDKKQYLGQFYGENIYMILSQTDRLAYQDIWPEMSTIRLQNEDFNKVEDDPSICKLYSDEGLDVYCIQSIPNIPFKTDPFKWAK